MPKKRPLTDRILDAALKLAAERGWHALSLSEVAAAAGSTLAETYRVTPSKAAILETLARRIDAEVLKDDPVEADSIRPRDRLFDVLMRRFDALQRHRAGIGAIIRDCGRDPLAIVGAAPQFQRSMRWMGVAAGLPMDGLAGLARTQVIGAAWASALRSWLYDDSPDLARTMAALDRRLRWAERFTPLFPREDPMEGEPGQGPASGLADPLA